VSERDHTHACPLNDHSGSNGVGTPSSFHGHPMSTVASMQESTMRRLFSARFRPMQILYALATPTISTLRYYSLHTIRFPTRLDSALGRRARLI
jgi:hypothetical protein